MYMAGNGLKRNPVGSNRSGGAQADIHVVAAAKGVQIVRQENSRVLQGFAVF
jgi:hypothetical protein